MQKSKIDDIYTMMSLKKWSIGLKFLSLLSGLLIFLAYASISPSDIRPAEVRPSEAGHLAIAQNLVNQGKIAHLEHESEIGKIKSKIKDNPMVAVPVFLFSFVALILDWISCSDRSLKSKGK